ncbi:MAG: hypothetical protein ABW019_08755 [Chitinophagaceae bacterium]
MTLLMKTGPVLLGLFLATRAAAQPVQNLYFTKKNRAVAFGNQDYLPVKTNSFYLYRNCTYDFILKNKLRLSAKIVDIKNDSIYYTGYSNSTATIKSAEGLDTFSLHPSRIKKLNLIADRIMGLYSGIDLRDYRYMTEQAALPKRFVPKFDTVHAPGNSVRIYELVPFMTAQGINLVYRQQDKSYYYEGNITEKADTAPPKKYPRKKGVWFTPSNASEITGLNIGLVTMPGGGDSLLIRGLNVNADILSMFVGVLSLVTIASDNALINFPDPVDKSSRLTRVHGVSLSFGGLGVDQFRGISLNGFIYMVTETKGLVITGFQNIAADFSGVLISPLRNKSVTGKGLQIGLFNICKNLKGVQVGLWNVNSKRKLPLINWSF